MCGETLQFHEVYEYQKELQHYLQTRVKIDNTKITINYVDEDDLERIVKEIIHEELVGFMTCLRKA